MKIFLMIVGLSALTVQASEIFFPENVGSDWQNNCECSAPLINILSEKQEHPAVALEGYEKKRTRLSAQMTRIKKKRLAQKSCYAGQDVYVPPVKHTKKKYFDTPEQRARVLIRQRLAYQKEILEKENKLLDEQLTLLPIRIKNLEETQKEILKSRCASIKTDVLLHREEHKSRKNVKKLINKEHDKINKIKNSIESIKQKIALEEQNLILDKEKKQAKNQDVEGEHEETCALINQCRIEIGRQPIKPRKFGKEPTRRSSRILASLAEPMRKRDEKAIIKGTLEDECVND